MQIEPQDDIRNGGKATCSIARALAARMNGFDRPTDDMTAVWWCRRRYETFVLVALNRNKRGRDHLGIARVDRIWKGFMKRSLLIEARFMVISELDGDCTLH